MYQIKDIEGRVENWTEQMKERIAEQQDRLGEELLHKVKSRAYVPPEATRNPSQFSSYISSIKKSPTTVTEDTITTKVSSDKCVYWEKKNKIVPIGAFLEWGTGPLGKSTNTYEHGYDYTLETWDVATEQQYAFTGTFGIPAVPHFHPSVQEIKIKYKEMLRD